MREADALEDLWGSEASARRLANLQGRHVESGIRPMLPNVGIPTLDSQTRIPMPDRS